jgi:hypothetical protein
MRNWCLRFGLAAATLLCGWSARAFGTDVSLDWKVRYVSVTPSPTYEGPVTIVCRWRATVVDSFWWDETISWSGMFLVDGTGVSSFTASYTPNKETYVKPSKQDWAEVAGGQTFGGTATNEFNGTREQTVNLTAGSHKVGCAIALVGETGESSNRKKNNKKQITIEVKPLKQLTPGQFPSYKPPSTSRIAERNKAPLSAVKNVSLPRPQPVVVSLESTIDANCKDPYSIAKVDVLVRTDLPLSANRGWVDISEPGKEWLSGKAELPAIGAGATVSIAVTLAAAVPPSTLAGYHNLVIRLQPKQAGGSAAFDPPADTGATLFFPPGYCPSAKVIPPPQGGRRLRPAPNATPPARRTG